MNICLIVIDVNNIAIQYFMKLKNNGNPEPRKLNYSWGLSQKLIGFRFTSKPQQGHVSDIPLLVSPS